MSENQPTKSPTRLWLRVLLGLSLALNLLVVGLVGGAMIRFGGPDGMRAPPRSVGAVMFRELSREDRRALWRHSNGDHRARHKEDAQAVNAAMRAIPFETSALEALLRGQAEQRLAFRNTVQQAWLTRVAAMSDAEREAYADRLEHALNRPRFRSRHERRRHD